MTVGAAVETMRGRSGELDPAGSSFVRVYDVTVTDPQDNPFTAAGLPPIDDPHPDDSNAVRYLFTKSQRGNHWKYWEVRAQYKDVGAVAEDRQRSSVSGRAKHAKENGESDPADPTKWRARFAGGSELVVLAVRKDLRGKPILNTAADWLDPPLTRPVRLPWRTVTQFESSEPTGKQALEDKVNANAYLGYAPRTLKLDSVGFSDEFYDPPSGPTRRIWRVEYKFSINKEGWIPLKVPSMGFNEIDDEGEFVTILLENGLSTPVPQPLDRTGKWTRNGDPHILEFVLLEEANFNELGIRS